MTTSTQVALARYRQTPGMLKALLIIISVATIAVMGIALGGVHAHRSGIDTVGVKAASSIIAANKMVASMQDLDADAASFLTGRPGANMQAEDSYDARRNEVAATLLDASRNVSFGESVEKPIRALQDGLVRYEAKVAEAKVLHEHGDDAFLASYRSARSIMEGELKPAASDLDKANQTIIEQVYSESETSGWIWQVSLMAVGLLLIAALVWTQLYLSRKTNRTVNPLLAAATAVAVIGVLYTGYAFHVQSSSLSDAKVNAFGTVHKLLSARAVAFDAKGDESRWLLDRPLRDRYQTDFQAKSQQLMDGALEASGDAAKAYSAFFGMYQKIRSLDVGGQRAQAIAFNAGNDPGESNWAFTQFDQALGKSIDTNQKKLDADIASGFGAVAGYDYIAPVAAFLIILLTFLGLRPRMKEYEI
jgi:hypothetical protein